MITLYLGCALLLGVALFFVAAPYSFKRLKKGSNRLCLLVSILAVSLASIMGYRHFGAYSSLQTLAFLRNVKAEGPGRLIEQMQHRLAAQPNDAKGWYLLGRLYLHDSQKDRAVDALQRAYRLQPQEIDIALNYVEAVMLKERRLTPEAQKALQTVKRQQPKNPQLLNLMALDAFSRGDDQKAIAYWKALLEVLPPKRPVISQIKQMIEQAKQHHSSKLR